MNRISYLIGKSLNKIGIFSKSRLLSTSLSDNQVYPQLCLQASNNYKIFKNFKRNLIYTEVLEHVSKKQGKQYLEIISKDDAIMSCIEKFKRNDEHGNPKIYDYPIVGKISPSTLRYIKVLFDLKIHFKTLDDINICEIGVGYGGQCLIINTYFKPNTYCLVDIKPALLLAQRFLDNYLLNSIISYQTMNELSPKNYDLVISNYAFTELPRSIQDVYLKKIILNSSRGYITYNETTPDEFSSYKSGELLNIIPNSKIIKEEPLTHPKNCIIIWGH